MDSSDRRWMEFGGGASTGDTGSEGGTILLDEEYEGGARITLEKNGITAPYSITCGIYGWMVHTRFFSGEGEARAEYDLMKKALADIAERIPLRNDPELEEKAQFVSRDISEFVDRFP